MKFMYDVIDKASKKVVRKDAIQKLEVEGMTEESGIESIKFFCCGPDEEVINIRILKEEIAL